MAEKFRLTYATMFNPPEELHINFDTAIEKTRANLGKEFPMLIDGKDVYSDEKFEDRTPINSDVILAVFQKGTEKHAQEALAAARRAAPMWSHTDWRERVRLLRKTAELIDERIYDISAVMSLEVGKNRMESLGDVAESVDLIRYACYQMEKNNGFIVQMESDPLIGYKATNFSKLRPYGVWLVISPFNFPAALTGGPSGSALVTGNTLVIKPASDTPWVVSMMVECMREAGIPDGVVNFVTGPGRTLGQALIDNPEVDGVTFTGSYDVGMKIFRDFATGKYVRPTVLELGGKNPTIVSRNANLEDAAIGIMRSAFGLQGQKCSACSRVYVEEPVYDEFVSRLLDLTSKIAIGDPTERPIFLGPVINKNAYEDYKKFCAELAKSGKILTGGKVLTDGNLAKGYYCAPTVVVDLPLDHYLWKQEMFMPITTIAKVRNLDEAFKEANNVDYGLTAGFYGSPEEVNEFFDRINAGVVYANRPQGATTGAWPGFQPFGGWKASGATGKNAGGHYYLPLYMREQIQTLIEH